MSITKFTELGMANGASLSFTQRANGEIFVKPDSINLNAFAIALARMPRWSGSLSYDWSVAQHLIACVERMQQLTDDPRAALAVVLHDAHEAVTGDWPTPLKRFMPDTVRAWFDELQTAVDVAIYSKLKFGPNDEITRRFVEQVDREMLWAEREVGRVRGSWSPAGRPKGTDACVEIVTRLSSPWAAPVLGWAHQWGLYLNRLTVEVQAQVSGEA